MSTEPDLSAAREQVLRTLTRLKRFLNQPAPPKLSEADTKANFIEPHITALGYEGLEDISREYYVRASQEFIDYVLKLDGRGVVAIEAKALQTDLTDKHAAQLVQYCSVEGIEWCALTNGREIRLFNSTLPGALESKLVGKLDLLAFNSEDEFTPLFDQLWLLSKQSMAAPSGIQSWMEWRRLDAGLRRLLLNPVSPVITSIRDELRKTSINAAPDQVVTWFRQQLIAGDMPAPVTQLPVASDAERNPVTASQVPPEVVPPAGDYPPDATADRGGMKSRRSIGRITLQQIVKSGEITPPTALRIRRGGRNVSGAITPEGTIAVNGSVFDSPSAAAVYACSLTDSPVTAADGWEYWEYRDTDSGEWRMLNQLRGRPAVLTAPSSLSA